MTRGHSDPREELSGSRCHKTKVNLFILFSIWGTEGVCVQSVLHFSWKLSWKLYFQGRLCLPCSVQFHSIFSFHTPPCLARLCSGLSFSYPRCAHRQWLCACSASFQLTDCGAQYYWLLSLKGPGCVWSAGGRSPLGTLQWRRKW